MAYALLKGGTLESPTTVILLSISSFSSVDICFRYLGAPMLVACIFTITKYVRNSCKSIGKKQKKQAMYISRHSSKEDKQMADRYIFCKI